jgi:hypothetical protein
VPSEKTVTYVANRVTKEYANLLIVDKVSQKLEGTLSDGQTLTLPTEGMWEMVVRAEGAVDDRKKTYWIGVKPIETTITTDNSTPFDSSLAVTAKTTAPTARLYYSLDGQMWDEGAAVTITEDKVVYFIAIDPDGIASEVASKSFERRPAWEQDVTASANEHFLAGRIRVDEYLAYSQRFGFFTPFTLYLVNGHWVLDPNRPQERMLAPGLTDGRDFGMLTEPITVSSLSVRDDAPPIIKVKEGDPQPGEYGGALTLAIEVADDKDEHVTVHYTRDGSIPGADSPSFQDRQQFQMPEGGSYIIACYAKDSSGNETYRTFQYRTGDQ